MEEAGERGNEADIIKYMLRKKESKNASRLQGTSSNRVVSPAHLSSFTGRNSSSEGFPFSSLCDSAEVA